MTTKVTARTGQERSGLVHHRSANLDAVYWPAASEQCSTPVCLKSWGTARSFRASTFTDSLIFSRAYLLKDELVQTIVNRVVQVLDGHRLGGLEEVEGDDLF